MTRLSRYLNLGYTSRFSKYLSMVLPDRFIFSLFVKHLKHALNNNTLGSKKIELPKINHHLAIVNEINSVCTESDFGNDITVAVFGSVATDELINYSDFDGILIYNQNIVTNYKSVSKLRKLIARINLISHTQDSLQHHGILVVSTNELLVNSDELLINLLKESKLIYGTSTIQINITEKNNYLISLEKLIGSIENKLNQKEKWRNQYFFKNMLSELLLLPCVFLQYKNQQYVSKKESFELIKNHLLADEIILIHKLENIRTNWSQPKIQKSNLNQAAVNELKSNSKIQEELIENLSEIKEKLLNLMIRLKTND